LFRSSTVNEEELQLLVNFIKEGDGGSLAVAWQAVAVFQAMAEHVGNSDVEHSSKSRGIRQLAASVQRQAPVGASAHIADAFFSLAPHLWVLRTMRCPKHNLPLATIGQSPANAFGNRDLLLGRAKRHTDVPWTGTPLQLIEDFTKLIALVVVSDAQYGAALLGAQLVAIDLLKRRVPADVVAKYIENLRNSALERATGDSLKRFFSLDVALFNRAGGSTNASGEAIGGKPVPGETPTPKHPVAGVPHGDRKPLRQPPVSWPFRDSTCMDFNNKFKGCSRPTTGLTKCKFRHSCCICNQKHPMHEHDQKHVVPLAIE